MTKQSIFETRNKHYELESLLSKKNNSTILDISSLSSEDLKLAKLFRTYGEDYKIVYTIYKFINYKFSNELFSCIIDKKFRTYKYKVKRVVIEPNLKGEFSKVSRFIEDLKKLRILPYAYFQSLASDKVKATMKDFILSTLIPKQDLKYLMIHAPEEIIKKGEKQMTSIKMISKDKDLTEQAKKSKRNTLTDEQVIEIIKNINNNKFLKTLNIKYTTLWNYKKAISIFESHPRLVGKYANLKNTRVYKLWKSLTKNEVASTDKKVSRKLADIEVFKKFILNYDKSIDTLCKMFPQYLRRTIISYRYKIKALYNDPNYDPRSATLVKAFREIQGLTNSSEKVSSISNKKQINKNSDMHYGILRDNNIIEYMDKSEEFLSGYVKAFQDLGKNCKLIKFHTM